MEEHQAFYGYGLKLTVEIFKSGVMFKYYCIKIPNCRAPLIKENTKRNINPSKVMI